MSLSTPPIAPMLIYTGIINGFLSPNPPSYPVNSPSPCPLAAPQTQSLLEVLILWVLLVLSHSSQVFFPWNRQRIRSTSWCFKHSTRFDLPPPDALPTTVLSSLLDIVWPPELPQSICCHAPHDHFSSMTLCSQDQKNTSVKWVGFKWTTTVSTWISPYVMAELLQWVTARMLTNAPPPLSTSRGRQNAADPLHL